MQNYIEQYRQIVQRQQELAASGYASKEAPIALHVEAKKDKKIASIYLLDAVDKWYGVSAQTIQEAMKGAEDADEINVYINSPGGSVFEGNTMINLLKTYKGQVNTYTYGMAASMGAVISQVAKEKGGKRYMSDNSAMMIHGVRGFAYGTARDIESQLKLVNLLNEQMQAKFMSASGQSAETVKEWMSKDTWFSPQEALEAGLVDEITIEPAASLTAMFAGMASSPTMGQPHTPAHTPTTAPSAQHTPDNPTAMKQLIAHFAAFGLTATMDEAAVINALQARMDELQAAANTATANAAKELQAFAEANKLVADAHKPAFEGLLKTGQFGAAAALMAVPVVKEVAVVDNKNGEQATGLDTQTPEAKAEAEAKAQKEAERKAAEEKYPSLASLHQRK